MTRALPVGTVTFLFTDVEGSTKLLHELGAEAYGSALADHRKVIRAAVAAQGGARDDGLAAGATARRAPDRQAAGRSTLGATSDRLSEIPVADPLGSRSDVAIWRKGDTVRAIDKVLARRGGSPFIEREDAALE